MAASSPTDTTATTASATIARPQAFDIRPLASALGAEVRGLDLGRPLSTDDFRRIHQAHLDHHVLVFRDQRIAPEQQIDRKSVV